MNISYHPRIPLHDEYVHVFLLHDVILKQAIVKAINTALGNSIVIITIVILW
jgi:hypothetical protein